MIQLFKKRKTAILATMLLLVGALSFSVAADGAGREDKDSYAVVVSRATYDSEQWRKVVDALKQKHDATVLPYDTSVEKVVPALSMLFPRYICFVATPEEAGRKFVASVHRLTRRLDSDPYTDAIWGIITGYDAKDALRIASYGKPLVVSRALTGTVGASLEGYDEGLMFNELKKEVMWEKRDGGEIVEKVCPQDTTKAVVDALNNYKPDIFITSGHATERDWQMGYSYRNGQFRCKDGQLFALDTNRKRYDINSPNPKVFTGVGNCLIGNIPDRQCMALAMMRSAGVYQFVGYTIPTGYGYGGWGVKDYFSELQAGRFTLAEAQYANNLALVYNLEKRDGEPRGLAGDRDAVAFYGDPAWEAKMVARPLPWSQVLTVENGIYTFTIVCNQRDDWDNRPIVHLLPHRVKDVKIVEGAEYEPVITDNFILLPFNEGLHPMKGNRGETIPLKCDYKKGQTFKIVFEAEPCL